MTALRPLAASALACAACGSVTSSTGAPATTSVSALPSAPGPAVAGPSASVAPTPTSLAAVTPTAAPTLAGVRYIVPPGWTIATSSAVDVRLTTGSGLTIELTLADGSAAIVTASSGRPLQIGGVTAYEADARSGSFYRDQIDASRAGHVYEVVCTSPDPTDRETTVDICEGFADGMTWAS